MQQLCPSSDVEEFIKRLIFGVCIGNNDMHLKNWGVIYPNGRDARIAPLYDFVCTRRYFQDASLALTIGGERDFHKIDDEALRRFAKRAALPVRLTLALAREIVDRLHDVWKSERDTLAPNFVKAIERHFETVPR